MIEISNFEFDNVSSHVFGLVIGSIGTGGINDINTYANMEIMQDRATNRPAPFYYGTKLADNLEFPMEIYNKHGEFYESYEVQAIQEWLFGRRKPKLLSIFEPDKSNESYECWLVDPSIVKMDGKVIGWKFTVRCTSTYSITNIVEERYECNNEENIIEFHNFSNIEDYLYPEMNIQLEENTSYIRIENEQDPNNIFQINGVRDGESIYINNDLGYINALSGDNIFDHFNLNFFRFVDGYNRLHVTGRCVITFRNRFAKAVGGY